MRHLIVILGPTASGKSALAVQLAKKFKGEVISADSRQVYKGLNIGSGKITKKEMGGIPHHLLNIASPKRKFTVSQYAKFALKAIASVQKKDRIPFLVGGSPLYIYAVVDGWVIPEVKPNAKLRKQLEKLTAEQLLKKLQKLDPERAKTIEQKNPRRLIRALEIVMTTKKPVPSFQRHPLSYPMLFLGVKKSPPVLKQSIQKRFFSMLRRGFLNEIKDLRKQGLSWKRIEDFGLEYREGSQYLQGKISQQEMIEKTIKATEDFARRQMTWFKKDRRIRWVESPQEAEQLTHEFILSLSKLPTP